jgi:2-iminoacetate synthase ThiH
MNELEMREMIVAAGKIPFERNGAYEKITT